MKALSLTQPWASLVAIGAKNIETRSWYSAYRGPVAIHASKGFPATARQWCTFDLFEEALLAGGYENADELPVGSIVAVANLVAVRSTETLAEFFRQFADGIKDIDGVVPAPNEVDFGDYSKRRYGLILDKVKRLGSPIPCRGALQFWNVPPEIAEQLEQVVPA